MSRSRSGPDREALNRELARLPRDVTTAITRCMKQRGMNRTELAHKMGVSPGRVSQILSGDGNITLGTLAAVCVALDARLETKLVPSSSVIPPAVPPVAHPAGPVSAPARYAAVAATR
jgi:transcriptional regulator with XRE-family HTH domain